jgi:cell division protease FtsH
MTAGAAQGGRSTADPEVRRGTPADGAADDGRWRVPWRVEGARPDPQDDKGWAASWRRPGGSRFWTILALLLTVNYLVSALALAPPQRLEVPYTLFREQVQRGNVAEVVATGDRIEGRFENAVTYPEREDRGCPGSRRT